MKFYDNDDLEEKDVEEGRPNMEKSIGFFLWTSRHRNTIYIYIYVYTYVIVYYI